MANPFPFVAGSVLTAAELNGIGEWTSYTPLLTASVTNPTLGAASSSGGRYARIQDLVIYQFFVAVGGAGFNAGSGIYRISLPVTASVFGSFDRNCEGQTLFYDVSAIGNYFANAWLNSSTTLSLLYQVGMNGQVTSISSTAPVVPAQDDIFSGLIVYRAA